MEISKKYLGKKCSADKAYKYYFTIINGLVGLTNKEIDIVSRLYSYNNIISKSVTDEKLAGVLLFSKEYKSKIVKDLDIKPLLLNNYIGNLKEKGIILVGEDGLKWLNPKHTLETDKDVIQLIFNLKIEEDEQEEEVKQEQPELQPESKEEVHEESVKEEQEGVAGEANPNFNPDDPWADGQ